MQLPEKNYLKIKMSKCSEFLGPKQLHSLFSLDVVFECLLNAKCKAHW